MASTLVREYFYSKLREAHLLDKLDETVSLQHSYLKPILRPYQENAVRWMIERETTPDYFPGGMKIPSGGILADEMGLGKTVEILALILGNKKKKRKLKEDVLHLKTVSSKNSEFFCVCNNPKSDPLIVCSKCNKSQHRACVAKYRLDETEVYMCPNCWSSEKSLIESAATIIVTPTIILRQWESEIAKHISVERFKVFIYNGIGKNGWISPKELAEYDVVLTDYNILRSEIHYLSTKSSWKDRLRTKKSISLISPLNYINWWRVCLDEAQLVESTCSNASKMVKILPTVHRWAITGTPIDTSFDNLYGLVFFIDCKPYIEKLSWNLLIKPIRYGDPNPLINVLKKIMWRTCKSGVLDQINIPSQTEEINYIEMTEMEKYFYKRKSTEYSRAIQRQIVFYRELKFLHFSEIGRETKNTILERIKMLRQDCIVLTKITKSREENLIEKNILNPSELFQYLILLNKSETNFYLKRMKDSAEQKFESAEKKGLVKALGNIMFLNHLKEQEKLKICQNCNIPTDNMYTFLLCGHIICPFCMVDLKVDDLKSISCPCGQRTRYEDCFYIFNRGKENVLSLEKTGNYSSKITVIVNRVLELQKQDKDVKIIIFSVWKKILEHIEKALQDNKIKSILGVGNHVKAIDDFKNLDLGINCLLLPLAFGSKGLNLVEATHVFLVEPIMTPSEELQAIGRVHRIGQTKPTVVHRFILRNTIEEYIFKSTNTDKTGFLKLNEITMQDLHQLFKIGDNPFLS